MTMLPTRPLGGSPQAAEGDTLPKDIAGADAAASAALLRQGESPRSQPQPRTRAIAFAAGEVLSRPSPLPSLADARPLKGEIAALLGQCLRERYEWERPVAMHAGAVDQLLARKGLRGRGNLSWQLQADRKGEQVLLVVHAQGRPVESTPVLDLRRIPPGMVIVNLESEGLDEHQALMNDRFNAGGWTEGEVSVPRYLSHHASRQRPLHGLPEQCRIMLLGHGERETTLAKGQPYHTELLAGLRVKEVADELTHMGLEKRFAGTLYLESCSSGSGFSAGTSFAQALMSELASRGYRHVSVAGLPGITAPDKAGYNHSEVDALTTDLPQSLAQSRATAARLMAAREAHSADLAAAQPQPPGTRRPQDETTRALTRALHGEQSHIAGLKQLRKVMVEEKKGPNARAPLTAQRLRLAGVREWWGHLGAGTHTPVSGVASPRRAGGDEAE